MRSIKCFGGAILCAVTFIVVNCQDNDRCPTCESFADAFVIGFDPCAGVVDPNGGGAAFVINIPSKSDTVVAYNFPTGIYDFPPKYFINYRFNPFFPDSAATAYPIRIKFRYAKKSEKTLLICEDDILLNSLFFNNENEVILISVTK